MPAAQPASPEQEDLYLLLGVRRLLSVAAGLSDAPGNESGIADIRRQAKARQDYLKRSDRPAASAIADLYGDLAVAVDEVAHAADTRRTVVADMNRDAIKSAEDRGDAAAKRALGAMQGLTMITLGSLQGRQYLGSEQHGNVTQHNYRVYDEFPGWAEAGVMHLMAEGNNARAAGPIEGRRDDDGSQEAGRDARGSQGT